MENSINLTCKRAERPIEYLSFGEPRTFVQKGYEVYNGDKPICFISKDDSLGEWTANSFYKFENCEGLAGGLTKKEVLENIEQLLLKGTFYLTWDERKEVTEVEVTELEVSEKETKSHEVMNKQLTYDDTRDLAIKILDELVEKGFVKDCIDTDDESEFEVQDIIHSELNKYLEVTELEVSEKETKSHEVWKLFNELDDDGLASTKHYDEALCQKQNVQYHWDEDLTVEDIETVIEYFKNLKQLIKLERKVNKLAIYG